MPLCRVALEERKGAARGVKEDGTFAYLSIFAISFLFVVKRYRGARDIPRNPALVAGEERGCSLDPGTLHWRRGGEGVLGLPVATRIKL